MFPNNLKDKEIKGAGADSAFNGLTIYFLIWANLLKINPTTKIPVHEIIPSVNVTDKLEAIVSKPKTESRLPNAKKWIE